MFGPQLQETKNEKILKKEIITKANTKEGMDGQNWRRLKWIAKPFENYIQPYSFSNFISSLVVCSFKYIAWETFV